MKAENARQVQGLIELEKFNPETLCSGESWMAVNATMFDRYLPFSCPLKILSLLMLSAFHHFIITDWRCVFGQHSSFTFLF